MTANEAFARDLARCQHTRYVPASETNQVRCRACRCRRCQLHKQGLQNIASLWTHHANPNPTLTLSLTQTLTLTPTLTLTHAAHCGGAAPQRGNVPSGVLVSGAGSLSISGSAAGSSSDFGSGAVSATAAAIAGGSGVSGAGPDGDGRLQQASAGVPYLSSALNRYAVISMAAETASDSSDEGVACVVHGSTLYWAAGMPNRGHHLSGGRSTVSSPPRSAETGSSSVGLSSEAAGAL